MGFCPTASKLSFETIKQANNALMRIAHRQRAQGVKVAVQRSYRCECKKFHHTATEANNPHSKTTGPETYARRVALIEAMRQHYAKV